MQLFNRKNNGDEYEPCSLTSLLRSIDRQLRDLGSLVRILEDREFESSCKVLKAKRKELRRQGKGRRVNAAQPLSSGEEGKL